MLVGCVGIFVGQTESEEDARNLKGIVHLGDEGNRSALADEDSLFGETRFEGVNGLLKNRIRVGRDPRFAGAEHFELIFHGSWQELGDVAFDELDNLLRDPDREQDAWRAWRRPSKESPSSRLLRVSPQIPSISSVGRTQRRSTMEKPFSPQSPGAPTVLRIDFPAKVANEGPSFLARERGDVFVETWNRDAEIAFVKFRDHFGQNRDGIGNGATERSGMQVLRRSSNFNLIIVQTPQTIGDRRDALGEHGCIGDDECVGFEARAIPLHEIPQADAADFFFALDHHFHIQGEFPDACRKDSRAFKWMWT